MAKTKGKKAAGAKALDGPPAVRKATAPAGAKGRAPRRSA